MAGCRAGAASALISVGPSSCAGRSRGIAGRAAASGSREGSAVPGGSTAPTARRRARRSPRCTAHSLATSICLAAASARTVCATWAGALDLPRFGAGVEERRVGLGQDQLGRRDGGRLAQRGRVPERDRPGEAQHVAGRRAALGQFRVAGVTVEDHLLRRSVRGQDRQHVLVRIPVVDHQRLAGLLGDLDVRPEPVALHFRRRRCRGSNPARSRRRPGPAAAPPAARSRPARHPARRRSWRRPPSRSGGWRRPRIRRGTRPRNLPPTVTTARHSRL